MLLRASLSALGVSALLGFPELEEPVGSLILTQVGRCKCVSCMQWWTCSAVFCGRYRWALAQNAITSIKVITVPVFSPTLNSSRKRWKSRLLFPKYIPVVTYNLSNLIVITWAFSICMYKSKQFSTNWYILPSSDCVGPSHSSNISNPLVRRCPILKHYWAYNPLGYWKTCKDWCKWLIS